MAAFMTSYDKVFEVVTDELNKNSVKVCDGTSLKPICIIRNVNWWDKDGIQEALEEHKDLILKKMEEKGIGNNSKPKPKKTPVQALEEIVSYLAKSMGNDNSEDFKYCAEHIGMAITKLKSVA